MDGSVIGLLAGLAIGLSGFLAIRAVAARVEKPETAQALSVLAWADLLILTAGGYLVGSWFLT